MKTQQLKHPQLTTVSHTLIVENGGTLVLRNSRILADPFGMPIYISVSDGGKIIAENCTFSIYRHLIARVPDRYKTVGLITATPLIL